MGCISSAAGSHAAPHSCRRDSIMMNCPVGVGHAFATILFLQLVDLLFRGDKHHLLAGILVGDLVKNFRVKIHWYQVLIDQKEAQIFLHVQLLQFDNELLEERSQIFSLSQLIQNQFEFLFTSKKGF